MLINKQKLGILLIIIFLKIENLGIFCQCQINDLSLQFIEEESPGSTKTQCQLTAGGGDPRDSATENKPPNQGKGETAR